MDSNGDRTFDAKDETELRVALRRCSEETYLAARQFRLTGSPQAAKTTFMGMLERFTDRTRRSKLASPDPQLRLTVDLGIDSLTLMELVMVMEEVFRVTIPNEDLSNLRTVGDVLSMIESRVQPGITGRTWPGIQGSQPSLS